MKNIIKVMTIGAILGLVGFFVGFYLPILLTPLSPQGPMVGIFVSGPLSFFLGIAFGCLHVSKVFSTKQVIYMSFCWVGFLIITTIVRCLH
ncbi:MAG: hypothetical protein FIA91_06740 [Geobacter sp.]|nr:hypothetical protein [Geobacter sp.]